LGRILIFLGAVPDHPLAHWRSLVASPIEPLQPVTVKERRRMSAAGRLVRRSRFHVIAGWIASILGMALWTYAYFVTGTPSLIPWGNFLPPWAAEWLPNLEAEIGLVLIVAGSVPLYWEMWRSR
jgi:hypothetical protein